MASFVSSENCFEERSAYKVGTTLHKSVTDGMIQLSHLNSAEKCTKVMDAIFGIGDVVSGFSISQGVRTGNTGKSPPRRGRPPKISDEDFKLLCAAIYTLEAIEQANTDASRLDHVDVISLVGTIVKKASGRASDGWR
jgi:hypothetical protein